MGSGAMRWIHERLGEGVAGNVVSLYGAYLVNYAVPLFTIPYLVRALGASTWGLVAMAQGLGNYLNLVVEYGFNLSATREVARHRENAVRIANLVGGVTGAKALLAIGGILLTVLLQYVVPGLQEHRDILWAGVAAGIATGMNPLWYFQGCERMKVVATLEVGTKVAAALGIFVFVHGPADAWRVAGLQAAASLLSTGVGLVLMYVDVRTCRVNLGLVRQALRTGWTMFIFRSTAMLYTSGNSFLLGFFAPPAAVGYFAGAEKISKAFMGLLNPFNQALYPRLSKLAVHDRKAGSRLLRTNAVVAAAGGLLLGVIVYVSAPLLVGLLLGREFAPAVPVLRLLAVLPFLIGMNTVLCTQWMAPLGMDTLLNRVILGASAVNIGLAVVLAPRFQHMGMAIAVAGAELFITLTAGFILLRGSRTGQPAMPQGLPLPDMETPA
jgi:polysaccharide transporter, PST family